MALVLILCLILALEVVHGLVFVQLMTRPFIGSAHSPRLKFHRVRLFKYMHFSNSKKIILRIKNEAILNS